MDGFLHIVCPHCGTVNRLPRAKLAAGGHCGECHKRLFEGRPAALDTAGFERHSAKSDLPILVDFWAPWCGPCRAMAPAFERAAGVLEPAVRLVKVNVDEEPGLADRFGVRTIPTMALVLHGRELARSTGARSADDIVNWVRGHLPE